jgi:micrococcal nuclease
VERELVGGFLILLGFGAFAVAVIGLVKGSLPAIGLAGRKSAGMVAAGAFVAILLGGSMLPPVEPTASESTPSDPSTLPSEPESTPSPVAPAPPAVPSRPAAVPEEAQIATVTRHVDGDTLWLEGGTLPPAATSSVRLLEIDSPEPGVGYSSEASNFLKQELPIGATVYLLADRGDTDRFGRYLRYLWKQNGEFFNEKAVRQGFAKAVLIAPNDRFISQIRAAEADAKAARRGMWAAPIAPPAAPPAPAPRAPAPAPAPQPAPAPAPPAAGGDCDPSYPDYCIPPNSPDLDCGDIRRSLTVLPPDPHRLDGMPGQVGEPDGVGCESYA